MDNAQVIQKALEYLEYSKDQKHSNIIQNLLDERDYEELRNLLNERMSFGTAGLRASLGPGLNQMNCLVVLQTTQGVIQVLEEEFAHLPDWKSMGVVIGFDHRHESMDFAHLIAGCFIGKGIRVYLYRKIVATPMVPFGIKSLEALAGIMITASHNPKEDNGYKLYWRNACQIIPPMDSRISEAILNNLKPWNWNPELNTKSIDPEHVIQEYFQQSSNLRFCYTAMHGVGYPFAEKIFQIFGLSGLIPVKEQIMPDPDFPTVKYPNPEEGEGALKLAITTATENDCKIILANDPDADRLAVAEQMNDGDYYIFSGNELGAVLGVMTFESFMKKNPNADRSKIVLLASTVSSHFLQHFAQKEGLQFRETLSGFKWLGNETLKLREEGLIPIFAFEEAIGYMIGNIVADKDGISALGVLAENVNDLYGRKKTLLSYLHDLYANYGLVISDNGYYKCYSSEKIRQIFERFRYGKEINKKLCYPTKAGDLDIQSIRDLTVGYDSSQPDNLPLLPVSSSSQMITLRLSNGCVFTVRTSGTEPKIKYYSEIWGENVDVMRKELQKTVKGLIALILEPEANGLIPK